ncbi:aspartate aminotransferase family protein [Gluconacetobacter sacchari]|uniref:aspartate aminotransferase family protein n=1 Tax=Gluconacetobacter sacchari TaxID=92759 RepID=UPI0039B3D7C2
MTYVLHRSLKSDPEYAVAGNGIMLTLQDGRQIIDAAGGAAVSCLGHGHPRVVDAITRQAKLLDYVHTMFVTSDPAEALAEEILGNEPGGLTHAFFTSSGSEAMESALKMARQYHVERGEPQRVHYISRRQSYHGNNFGTMALSGHVARRAPYEAILPTGFSQVSPCFPYRYQGESESDNAYVARLAAELEAEFQRIGPERVIAFAAETVVGATAGCVVPVPGYFKAMREVCDRHGALLILDEVMCGMGRTGTCHAWEQEGVAPDLQAVAKGLGGGYAPVGALLVSRKVIDAVAAGSGAFVHGHTYQAHPIACAAALEVQRIIREEALLDNVKVRGEQLRAGLIAALGRHPHVGDIRGRGLFLALEFVADRGTRTPFASSIGVAARIKATGLANGIALYPNGGTIDGRRGDHVVIAPPYTVSESQVDDIVERVAAAISSATVDHVRS